MTQAVLRVGVHVARGQPWATVLQFLATGISLLEARIIDHCQGSTFADRCLNSKCVSGGGHIAQQSPGFLYVLLADGLSECARSRLQTFVNLDMISAEQRTVQKRRKRETQSGRTDAQAHDDGKGPKPDNIPVIALGSVHTPDPKQFDLPNGFVAGSLWDRLVVEGIQERRKSMASTQASTQAKMSEILDVDA